MSSVYIPNNYSHDNNVHEFMNDEWQAMVIDDKECNIQGPLSTMINEVYTMTPFITSATGVHGAVVGCTYQYNEKDLHIATLTVYYEQGSSAYVMTRK